METTQATFTNANTYISANNRVLGFVQEIDVEDFIDERGEKFTHITLRSLVGGHEEAVNDMRSGPFSFKIINNSSGGGYIAPIAEIRSFKMHMVAHKDDRPDFFEQIIIIKTKSFLYSKLAKDTVIVEQEDYKNLINILKENQKTGASANLIFAEVKEPALYKCVVPATPISKVPDTKPGKVKNKKK